MATGMRELYTLCGNPISEGMAGPWPLERAGNAYTDADHDQSGQTGGVLACCVENNLRPTLLSQLQVHARCR